MVKTVKGVVLAIVLCAMCCDVSRGDELTQIIERTRSRNATVESAYVKYRIRSKVLGSPADVKRYMNVVAEIDEIKTTAFKNSKRYDMLERNTGTYIDIAPDVALATDKVQRVSEVAGTPAGAERVPSGLIQVEKTSETAFDGSSMKQFKRGDKQAFVYSDADIAAAKSDKFFFNGDYHWLVYHALPDVFSKTDTRAMHRLPDVLESGKAVVQPEREEIDGHSCVVIHVNAEPKEVLWCDPMLNYAVRRWDRYESGTDHRTWRYELSDFTQVNPGFWLPKKGVRLRWATTKAPEDLRQTPLMKYVYDVLEMHANDVPDALFTLTIPTGTEVIDFSHLATTEDGKTQAVVYSMPANGKDLDKVIENAQETISRSNTITGLVPKAMSSWRWVIAANVILVAALGLIWFYSKKGKSNRENIH